MFELTAKIEIKSDRLWTFDKVASVEITRDMETLTDTCVIQLPQKIKWQGMNSVPVKRGDQVSVWLGYDNDLQFAFGGFITAIGLKSPVTITCEDYMFLLKNTGTKKLAYKSVTIEQLLKDQNLAGIKLKVCGEQRIGQYRIAADTVSALLADLRDHNGVRSFISVEDGEPVLHCGVMFDKDGNYEQVFSTGVNIIDDHQLEVQSSEDVKVHITAVSLMPNNAKIKVEVGDEKGEKRMLRTYNKTKEELQAWALQELERLKRDGLTGSFVTFGGRLLDKLGNIGIKMDGQRKGIYQVQKNVIKYSASGFRQEITLGARTAE